MPLTSIREIFDEIKQDLTDYLKVKGDILQLKAAEKGSPIVAKTIYTSMLVVFGIIAGTIALIAAIFALALIFVESGTDPFSTVRALTFGALCLLGLFLLIIFILLAVKDRFISSVVLSMINKVIDQQEEKEREVAGQELGKTADKQVLEQPTPFPNAEDFVQTNKSKEESL